MPIYVIGAVENPRPIYSRDKLTLSRAVSIAGGIAKNGDQNRISIFRRENGSTTVIEAGLEKIRADEKLDIELKPFDIIEVTARGSAKRKYPPVAEIPDLADTGTTRVPLVILD